MTGLKKEEKYLGLGEVNSQSLQAWLKNLDDAYKCFFKKQNKFPDPPIEKVV